MNTYVLMLSKVFPQYHPRKGEATGFRDKLLVTKVKKHTLRKNATHWERIAEEVNAGKAILSIRQWSGKPYAKDTRQIEIARLTRLGVQRIRLSYVTAKRLWQGFIPYGKYERRVNLDRLAMNDGLETIDFEQWFGLDKATSDVEGIILHFTEMRY